jgi:LacI family transcriptional regulator
VGRRATIRELAAETGLSAATVSRALNGHENVASHTRALVLDTADRMRQPATRRATGDPGLPPMVYLRCPYVLTDYFGLIVSAICETLERHDMAVLLNAGKDAAKQGVLGGLPGRPGVAGAILVLPTEPEEELVRLRDRRFPYVVVDPRLTPPRDVAAVSAAHFAGARSITNHLVDLGHRRIAIIGGPREWLVSDTRLAGYAAPLARLGLLPEPALIRHVTEPNEQQGFAAAQDLLAGPELPTAIVAFNDKMAVGAWRAALARGLRVPADVSIVGFDDLEISRATEPMLTTVRQPLAEMGRMAVNLLSRLLEGHELDALHVELATELVVRGSTGPVPTRH